MSDQRLGEEYRPSTEEEIRAATVGELAPLSGPIQIIDYDPEWPLLFRDHLRTKRELARRN